MRILLADNLMLRRYGNLRMGPGRKLMCGAIRGNHRICEFSDRDIARYLAPLGLISIGRKRANKKFLLCAKNFAPDVVLLGHCDFIENETLDKIREILPNVKIAHFNVDPLCDEHPKQQMRERMYSCDALFATTGGSEYLKPFVTGKNIVAYMPNPSDPSMENQDNSTKTTFERDLFFAGQPREGDPRMEFITKLREQLLQQPLKFDTFGMFGTPSIWGAPYERVLATSKMSINLNRYTGMKWYSSDRIAHLMGYGILTALSDRDQMQHFFSKDDALWYHDVEDLVEKLTWYNTHDDARIAAAANGRKRYHALFNGERVLRFMLETLTGAPYSESYEWQEEVYS